MRLLFVGSGGASPPPRPCCDCRVCRSAREGGREFRTGPSLFLPDHSVLFDTPEEIRIRLNQEDVKEVKHLFYTHWHPDHAQGMRLFEHLKTVPEKTFFGNAKSGKAIIHLPRAVHDDFINFYGEVGLKFFEETGFARIDVLEDDEAVVIGSLRVEPVALPREGRYAYLLEEGGRRALYAPCSIFGLLPSEQLKGLDLFIFELGWLGETEEIRRSAKKDDPRRWHLSYQECVELIKELKPARAIATHVEEGFGFPPDYVNLKHGEIEMLVEKDGIEVAYDGLLISL